MGDDAAYTAGSGHPDLADLPEIVMFGDARHRAAEARLGPHYNPGIEICLSRAGVYRWDIEGRPVEIKPGELSVTVPWQEHSGHDSVLGPGRLNWIILRAAGHEQVVAPLLARVLGKEADAVLAAFAGTRSYLGSLPQAARLFDHLREELASRRPGRIAAIRADWVNLLVMVARRLREPDELVDTPGERVPDPVMAVLRRVAEEPAADWTSASMAADAGLGLTAFTEWCRRATGRSPRWYVLAVRLERGRRLVESTDESITGIALETGFSSSQHFASAFRKLYGESPSRLRGRRQGRSGTTGTNR